MIDMLYVVVRIKADFSQILCTYTVFPLVMTGTALVLKQAGIGLMPNHLRVLVFNSKAVAFNAVAKDNN